MMAGVSPDPDEDAPAEQMLPGRGAAKARVDCIGPTSSGIHHASDPRLKLAVQNQVGEFQSPLLARRVLSAAA